MQPTLVYRPKGALAKKAVRAALAAKQAPIERKLGYGHAPDSDKFAEEFSASRPPREMTEADLGIGMKPTRKEYLKLKARERRARQKAARGSH